MTLGKEYVRCYKYKTENALVLLPAFDTPSGVVGGPRRGRKIGWWCSDSEQLVGEQYCRTNRKTSVSYYAKCERALSWVVGWTSGRTRECDGHAPKYRNMSGPESFRLCWHPLLCESELVSAWLSRNFNPPTPFPPAVVSQQTDSLGPLPRAVAHSN